MTRRRVWLLAILLFHLALTVAFSVVNPLGEAPDEADHWAYVVHLADTHALPVGPQVTQSKHPPLYHATAALIAALATPANDFLRANPDVQLTPAAGWSPNFFIHTARERVPWRDGVLAFHLVRLWSALLSTLTVAATYGLARAAFPGRPLLWLAAAGLLAGIPEFAFIGSAVNNDSAAALFGTLALWGACAIQRDGGRFRAGWWTPLALGFGLLTKTSTLGLWPVIVLWLVVGVARPRLTRSGGLAAWTAALRATWPVWLRAVLAVALPALLIAAPWLVRNWRLYGDPLGMALAVQTIDLRTTPWTAADSWWLLRGWFVSFWGKFGGAGHIPMANSLYVALLIVSGAALLGMVRIVHRRPAERAPLVFLLLAVGGVGAVMWRYSLLALGTDQGRLLYPAVAPIVILLAAGWLSLLPAEHQARAAAGIGLAAGLLGVYALVGVVQPAFAPPAAATLASPGTPRAVFGELELIDSQLEPELVLFWRTPAGAAADYRTVLRVVSQDGTLVWEWRRSPGAGRWSTDRWPAGAVIRDAYQIVWPAWAAPGIYHVEVGVQPYGGDLLAPDGDAERRYLPLGDVSRS